MSGGIVHDDLFGIVTFPDTTTLREWWGRQWEGVRPPHLQLVHGWGDHVCYDYELAVSVQGCAEGWRYGKTLTLHDHASSLSAVPGTETEPENEKTRDQALDDADAMDAGNFV